MKKKFIRGSIKIADGEQGSIPLHISSGSLLHSIVFETTFNPDADNERVTWALAYLEQIAGEPDDGSNVFHDKLRYRLATEGAQLIHSRFRYELDDEPWEHDKLFCNIDNNMGAQVAIKVKLVYYN